MFGPVPLWIWTAVFLASFAVGGTAAWKVQDWRLGVQIAQIEADQQAAIADATREARSAESRRFKEVQDAQAAAQVRAQAARRDADAARAAVDGLRDAIHAAGNGMPGEPASACPERIHAVGELLAQCAGSYQGMAEVADRLDSDRRTLIESWPK